MFFLQMQLSTKLSQIDQLLGLPPPPLYFEMLQNVVIGKLYMLRQTMHLPLLEQQLYAENIHYCTSLIIIDISCLVYFRNYITYA